MWTKIEDFTGTNGTLTHRYVCKQCRDLSMHLIICLGCHIWLQFNKQNNLNLKW